MEPRQFYSLFMIAALAVFLLARYLIPKPATYQALPWRKRALLGLAALVGGAFGAKLPFVLSPQEGWLGGPAWIADGKTITTGLIGAYLAVEIAKLALGIHVKTGDTFALPLALAMAVGRLGCFFNGCCAGLPTALPWGVDFGDGVRCHPTQLYECVFHLIMAGVLWELMRRNWLRNQRLKLYLIAYGCFRFLTEFIRPEPRGWLGLTFYQWVALFLIVAMTIQWQVDRPPRKSTQDAEPQFADLVH